MEPVGRSRDDFLKILMEIVNDTYPDIYFVPKKQKDEKDEKDLFEK